MDLSDAHRQIREALHLADACIADAGRLQTTSAEAGEEAASRAHNRHRNSFEGLRDRLRQLQRDLLELEREQPADDAPTSRRLA